ncbi:hypothetical protein MLD38_000109 [Melastoma candidum]|uniref:Uncharacterized protein n=1 Tax=Melastoma candidum TaxID=119954 RepID=A0ACB9SCB3_9MYRT|nr:hypothetical protein MLD38_000109 [Melastoma candidum]
MDNLHSFWQLGDELRGQSRVSEDNQWLLAASKLAAQTRPQSDRMNNPDVFKAPFEARMLHEKVAYQEDNNRYESNLNFNMFNLETRIPDNMNKGYFRNGIYEANGVCPKSNLNSPNNPTNHKYYSNSYCSREQPSTIATANDDSSNVNNAIDKRFKTLPAAETLPRNEVLGGYIFVCNNDTMQEDLKRQLFGLPLRYRDSVRAITPGLPLFLYNYTTHQLHGIFEAAGFGGTNIDPTAWEDKKCKGESRFPAQVRIRIRKLCKALEEDAFRPVLHHYDGPKFRLELSVPETLDLLDLCEQAGSLTVSK